MTDEPNELAEIQISINQQLYADILTYYKILMEHTDSSTAIGMLISALSTNLGAIIAQLPDSHRDRYALISKEILDNSMIQLIEEISFNKWGKIGHA